VVVREISTVLLPGLDGTGLMLSEFAAALGAFTEVKIVRYPHFQPWDYDALLSFVRTQLPDTPHVVIGESFSGPLALRLAQEGQTELRGIILGASFARLDLPFKKAISCLTGIVSPRIVPTDILAPFLLGRWSTAVHRRRLRSTLTQVSPQVLSVRAKAALAVDQTTGGNIRLPVLYLRASEDRLIPKSATNVIAALAPRIEIREIAAPHFLFQAAPMECAAAVRTFYEAMAEG
jgi:pimeloyl-ACP methyl ester carboxylesterase